jgi:hypothetical protein
MANCAPPGSLKPANDGYTSFIRSRRSLSFAEHRLSVTRNQLTLSGLSNIRQQVDDQVVTRKHKSRGRRGGVFAERRVTSGPFCREHRFAGIRNEKLMVAALLSFSPMSSFGSWVSKWNQRKGI